MDFPTLGCESERCTALPRLDEPRGKNSGCSCEAEIPMKKKLFERFVKSTKEHGEIALRPRYRGKT
jgi:hypothetical protein